MIKLFIIFLISATFCTAQKTVEVLGKSNIQNKVGEVIITYLGRPYSNKNVSFLGNGDFQFSFNNSENLKDVLISFEVGGYEKLNIKSKVNGSKIMLDNINFISFSNRNISKILYEKRPNIQPNPDTSRKPKPDTSRKKDYTILIKKPTSYNENIEIEIENIKILFKKNQIDTAQSHCKSFIFNLIEHHVRNTDNERPIENYRQQILIVMMDELGTTKGQNTFSLIITEFFDSKSNDIEIDKNVSIKYINQAITLRDKSKKEQTQKLSELLDKYSR